MLEEEINNLDVMYVDDMCEHHISITHAARYLGVSDTTLRKWIKDEYVFCCTIDDKMRIPISEIKTLIHQYGSPCKPNFKRKKK